MHRVVDPLSTTNARRRVFLAGWTALEILIGKLFGKFENDLLSPVIAGGAHPVLRERFVEHVRKVMAQRYRLTDKFLAVTAVLFAEAEAEKVEQYEETFKRVKKLRDAVTHGREFDEESLPIAEVTMIVRDYVSAALKLDSQ